MCTSFGERICTPYVAHMRKLTAGHDPLVLPSCEKYALEISRHCTLADKDHASGYLKLRLALS